MVIKYSVCVPIFNGQEYLEACIDSVINQSYKDWELILVDDGSTDNSKSICMKYVNKDSRIKYYFKLNSGQFETRQFAINESIGEYCLFLDSDDILFENAIECIDKHIRRTQCDCLVFGVKAEKKDGSYEFWTEKDNKCLELTNKRDIYLKAMLNQQYNSMCRKVIKRSISPVIDIDTKKFRHGEDYLQSLYIYKNANKVVYIPDILYFYRYNAKSVSYNKKFIDYSQYIELDKVLDLFFENEFIEDDFSMQIYKKVSMINYTDLVVGISGIDTDFQAIKEKLKSLHAEEYSISLLSLENCFLISGYRLIMILLFYSKMYTLVILLSKFKAKIKG